MPIDFEAIVSPFRTRFFLQRRTINQVFEDLGKLLVKRKRRMEEREQATRNLPIFFFMDDALSVWLDEAQHGALAPVGGGPEPDFLDKAAAPFVAFFNGMVGTTDAMMKSEWVLPNFLQALSRGLHAIAASIEKFKEPSTALFQLQPNRPASDLFGEVALFFKLLNDPDTAAHVGTLVTGAVEMWVTLQQLFPPAPKTEESMSLPSLSLAVAGAVLALPLAARLLLNLGAEMKLGFQMALLDLGREFEKEVAGLRASIVDFFFVDLRSMGRELLEWLETAQAVTACSITFYDQVVRDYLDDVKSWIDTVGPALKKFADDLVTFLYALGNYLNTLVDIDIGSALSYGIIEFTLADLDNPQKLTELVQDVATIELAASKFTNGGIFGIPGLKERIDAIYEVLGIAMTRTAILEEPAKPDLSALPHFPNIYDAFFGTAALDLPDAAARMAKAKADAQTLADSFTELGKTAKSNVDSIFEAGITGLNQVSRTFGEAGTLAAKLGSRESYEKVVTNANNLSNTVLTWDDFLDKAHPYQDPLADAMEAILVNSQFDLLTRSLPAYVAEMVAFWKQESKKPPIERPTSPQILAKRAQVNRVRVPRITLRVFGDRPLDKSLALEVATSFQRAVADAFRSGLELAEAGG